MAKLDAKQLRVSEPTPAQLKRVKHNPIYFVVDEVLDTYNIGSLFRLADAVTIEKMYLCGNMEYPPSSRVHKAAVGTENWVPWEKRNTALEVVQELKKKGVQIVVVEQSNTSVPYSKLNPNFPVAVVVGHETKGVSEEVLKEADIIVELPMLGVNKSFNVWGSAAVIAYKILESI